MLGSRFVRQKMSCTEFQALLFAETQSAAIQMCAGSKKYLHQLGTMLIDLDLCS